MSSCGKRAASCAVVIEFRSFPACIFAVFGVKGVLLGDCDSFMAEVEGAILACEFAVQCFRSTALWRGRVQIVFFCFSVARSFDPA